MFYRLQSSLYQIVHFFWEFIAFVICSKKLSEQLHRVSERIRTNVAGQSDPWLIRTIPKDLLVFHLVFANRFNSKVFLSLPVFFASCQYIMQTMSRFVYQQRLEVYYCGRTWCQRRFSFFLRASASLIYLASPLLITATIVSISPKERMSVSGWYSAPAPRL